MSRFISKFTGGMFGLACIGGLEMARMAALNEFACVKSQDANDETSEASETATTNAASAEFDETGSEIKQLQQALKRLKTSVAFLEN
ncbi:MAG: hypothetical protein ACKVII_17470 [Planctomycetales bacterium]|jgi:hypothetical protein